ncbi:MAG: ParB/RepB/Spo0J family partition protein [Treponema sp.]|jgi:ParB/RepB/Spo0J family partition protein|nr:ParB/RepB/Spo0J family partition protein [Treponema sp.]
MIEKSIPIDTIISTSNRENGGDGDLKILAEDIKHNGLINPVTVKYRLTSAENFVLVAGRRRLAAARLLGWKEIPCRILEGDETEHADDIALSENVNRLAMHPLDEAEIFRRLLEGGEPIQSIAKRYDRPVSGIWQRVQLQDLSPDIKKMFRNGKLDLQSAAMLKSLDKKEQAEFVKWGEDYVSINERDVARFVRNLHNDEVYQFLGKDCEKCKTRTFFTDNSLFPEAGVVRDACLDHGCYVKKWTKLLEARVESFKGEHQSHAAASLIVFDRYPVDLKKILGNGIQLDGADYKIAERDWSCFSDTKSAGAEPCFYVYVSSDGAKLHVKPTYWKKKETTDLKNFSAELKLLELPKDEDAAVRNALKAKKVDHYNFTEKVRQKVLYGLIAARAADRAGSHGDAELLLGNEFRSSAHHKKIYSLFTGKEYAGDSDIKEFLKLGDSAVFALLYALSLNLYDVPPVWSEKEAPAAFAWSGLPPGEIKKLYQEAIRELLPKPKAEKAPAKKGKKQ